MTYSIAFFFVLGLTLLVGGAEILVRGASSMARRFHISPLIIGLTIVAMGTSAPEVAVSVHSGLNGEADIAVGNVVGSNICNILLILGLSALAAPLLVSAQLIRQDVPVMIGVSLLTYVAAWDGSISRVEGAALFAGLAFYVGFLYIASRKASAAARADEPESLTPLRHWALDPLCVVLGLVLLVLGARWLVGSAVALADAFGVSRLVIGLTVVAVGTSLPELATSVVATIRGERDIAVGNVVGSNIFNLLGVLGLTGFVAPGGIDVAASALRFDLPVMIAVAFACLPIFLTGGRIDRWEGVLFLFYFAAYTGWLVLHSTGSPSLALFDRAMMLFVIPLTVVTLALVSWRHVRSARAVSA